MYTLFKHLLTLAVYKSCKDIYNENPASTTGIYDLEDGKHFCYMESVAGPCGAGGWTLALKVNGSQVSRLLFVIKCSVVILRDNHSFLNQFFN